LSLELLIDNGAIVRIAAKRASSMSEESLESILEAARKLPLDEQRRLAEHLAKQVEAKVKSIQTQRALEAVEKMRGSMKGLDRDTIIWLAEDEELCG